MIGRIFVAAAVVAASASIPAQAQQARSKGSDYSTKKICKVEDRIGSRLGANRTCRTQAEWDQIARDARMTTERVQTWAQPCLKGPAGPICSD
jgi:hypothetical protein